MGLDMYAYSTIPSKLNGHTQPVLLHRWRKHPDLHGWMRDRYIRNGGTVKTKRNRLEDFELFTTTSPRDLHKVTNLPAIFRSIELELAAHPVGDTFNLVPVYLTVPDLDELERAVTTGSLPRTTGLFYGESDGSERDDDLLFIAKARTAIGAGDRVWYVADR